MSLFAWIRVGPRGRGRSSPTSTGRRVLLLAALAALLFTIGWLVATIVVAVRGGEGSGGVFWAAIVLLIAVVAGLAKLAIRTFRGLKAG